MIASPGLVASASSRSASSPFASPSMIRRCSRSVTGSAASSAALASLVLVVVTPSNNSRKRVSGS